MIWRSLLLCMSLLEPREISGWLAPTIPRRRIVRRRRQQPQPSSSTSCCSSFSHHDTKQPSLTPTAPKDTVSPDDFGIRGLYPPSTAYSNGTLAVDHGHTLYYEVHGRRESHDTQVLNALFLHGGPGAGCTTNHARFFDPAVYRIVLWDQRGSGRSTPRGEVRNNTLRDIVEDAERLRQHLHIEQWDVILGGSWGVTVAVAYAQTYPTHVRSIVLRGVCLFRPCEVQWLLGDSSASLAQLNPSAWQTFCQAVQARPSNDNEALYAYYDRLLGDNNQLRVAAAQTWMTWEMGAMMGGTTHAGNKPTIEQVLKRTVDMPVAVGTTQWTWQNATGSPLSNGKGLDPKATVQQLCQGLTDHPDDYVPPQYTMRPLRPVDPLPTSTAPITQGAQDSPPQVPADFVPAQNIVTCFYSVNSLYAMNNVRLLNAARMSRIANIPCIAIHGGKDTVCPVDTALALKAQWPAMEVRIPIGASHSMYDAAIANQLVRATDRLAIQLQQQR